MNNGSMNDIETEVDMIRQNIWTKIKDMTPDEKSAYYHAQAEEARKEFNIKISGLKPARPVGFEHRRAYEAAFAG